MGVFLWDIDKGIISLSVSIKLSDSILFLI